MAPGLRSSVMLRGVPLLLVLAGCGRAPGLDPYGNETGEEEGLVSITSVDPHWGPPEGGTAVTITGEGFEGNIDVLFGEMELAATRIGEGQLLVTTPAAGVEITVDVTVTSDLGTGTLPGGFAFSDEAPVDTDTDTDTVDPTGKVGGVVQFVLLQIACPECFGLTSELDVSANAAFHDPVDGSWTSWLPASGSCTSSPSAGGPASTLVDVGEWVYLLSGSQSIGMRRTTGADGTTYSASGLANEDYARTAYYDVSATDGGSWGSFDVTDAMLTPQGFTDIQPVELLYIQPTQAFAATISRSGTSITWAPSAAPATSSSWSTSTTRAAAPTSARCSAAAPTTAR